LEKLADATPAQLLRLGLSSLFRGAPSADDRAALARMGLEKPKNAKDWTHRSLLLVTLAPSMTRA
jgi:hypothetical protein